MLCVFLFQTFPFLRARPKKVAEAAAAAATRVKAGTRRDPGEVALLA